MTNPYATNGSNGSNTGDSTGNPSGAGYPNGGTGYTGNEAGQPAEGAGYPGATSYPNSGTSYSNVGSGYTDASGTRKSIDSHPNHGYYQPAPYGNAGGYAGTQYGGKSAEGSGIGDNSLKGWFVNLLLEGLLGPIWWIVILVSDNQSESRKNYVKARLIMVAIFVALVAVVIILFGSTITAFFITNQNESLDSAVLHPISLVG